VLAKHFYVTVIPDDFPHSHYLILVKQILYEENAAGIVYSDLMVFSCIT